MGKDVTLVLDISGSMTGPPLDQAQLAAIDVLSRLSSDDRVNQPITGGASSPPVQVIRDALDRSLAVLPCRIWAPSVLMWSQARSRSLCDLDF
ncbi:MAG: hypothetical protein ACRBN8_40725 [Nannocystales bacterium]